MQGAAFAVVVAANAKGPSSPRKRWAPLGAFTCARGGTTKKPRASGAGAIRVLWTPSGLLAQPHDHVDAGDLVAFRRCRGLADDHVGPRDVEHLVRAFDEEVVMRRDVGIEVGLGAVDRDLAQQADLGELVQRVVDGGERHRHLGAGRLLVEHLGGQMPVALAEQDPAERHALAGRTQADLAQHRFHVVPRTAGQVGRARGAGLGRRFQVPQRVHQVRPMPARNAAGDNRFIRNIYTGTGQMQPLRNWRRTAILPRFPRGTFLRRWSFDLCPPRAVVLRVPTRACDLSPRMRDIVPMNERRHSFEYEDLLACGRGELFGAGNAQLPLPPMLMFDRISEISETGGAHGKGMVRAELEIKPDLWFFLCHFKGDPVMPGCLGLDALWQMVGFFLGWLGSPGSGRALGLG